MKVLPEVCLGPQNNPLDFWDDSDYDPDMGQTQNHCYGGLQSLTECSYCKCLK